MFLNSFVQDCSLPQTLSPDSTFQSPVPSSYSGNRAEQLVVKEEQGWRSG